MIDTFLLGEKCFPELKGFKNQRKPQPGRPQDLKLGTLAAWFGIQNPGAHRAENDVKTAGQLFYKLVEYIEKQGTPLATLGDLFQFQFKPRKVPKDAYDEMLKGQKNSLLFY